MQGWIKLHRQIAENPLWFSEPFTRGQAWIDLLLIANHKKGFFYVRGNKIDVDRGQIGMSEDAISTRWQWSRGKLRRFLSELEKQGQVVQQKLRIKSLITIVNYEKFQGDGTTDSTTDGQQTVQQTDTNKNVNNKKNVNNEKNLKTHTQKPASKTAKLKKEKVDYTEQFNEFWKQYPRRIAKDAAFKAYESVIKNKKATHTEIMMGVMQYAQETENTEPKFIKYPQGWLNSGRWKDPAASNTNSRAGYSTSAQPCKTTRTMQILAENNAMYESGELPMYGTGDEDIF